MGKWVARYRAEGKSGLTHRRSASYRRPRRTPARIAQRIERLRNLDPKDPVHHDDWPCFGDLLRFDIKPLSRYVRPGHRVEGRANN